MRAMQDPLLDLEPRVNNKTGKFIDADDTILWERVVINLSMYYNIIL